jgi:hypothetical protein
MDLLNEGLLLVMRNLQALSAAEAASSEIGARDFSPMATSKPPCTPTATRRHHEVQEIHTRGAKWSTRNSQPDRREWST